MDYVEYSVKAQKQDVVSSDVLDISQLIDHEQLGQDRHGLKPNAETPQEVNRIE
jgi:hypothetical protein